MKIILMTIFLLLPRFVSAAPLIQKDVVDYLSVNFPDLTANESDTGDLDGDGIPEQVLTLYAKDDNTIQIVVLKRLNSSELTAIATSKLFFNCQHGTEVYIHKKSLWISCFYSGDGTVYSFIKQQFAIRSSRFQLIGSEASTEVGPSGKPDPKFPDESVSTNYLTGNVITTKKWKGRIVKTMKTTLSATEREPRFLEDYDGY